MKICSLCDKPKPISEFPLRSLSKGGCITRCRPCHLAKRREIDKTHKENIREEILKRVRLACLSCGDK